MKRLFLLVLLLSAVAGVTAQVVSKNVQRADRAYQDNNFKKALDIYVKASSEEAVTAYIARQIGNCYRIQGDMVQAEIWYENALKQADHTALNLLLLGYTQKANGKNELSNTTLNKLYNLQGLPDLNMSPAGAGTFLARLRSGFISYKVTPASIELLELLAGIFCSKNELQRASQTYARVVYLEPHHGPALLALAELSDALGRSDEANRFRAKMKRLENL